MRLTCEDKGSGSSHESEECTRVGACGQVSTLSERHVDVDVVVSVFEGGGDSYIFSISKEGDELICRFHLFRTRLVSSCPVFSSVSSHSSDLSI